MVKHIVMWTLKPGLDKGEVLAQMHRIFHAFRDEVPGMHSLEIYGGYAGYDLCLVSEHEDKEALEAYGNFPAHLKAKEYVHSVIQHRAHCDFEM